MLLGGGPRACAGIGYKFALIANVTECANLCAILSVARVLSGGVGGLPSPNPFKILPRWPLWHARAISVSWAQEMDMPSITTLQQSTYGSSKS